MSALGKWLNRPRKRSQSSPTRQILSDFLNRPAPESHQPSYFPPEKHQQHYSSLPTNAGYYNNNTSTPMLITSSFYNLAYPFDQNDSSADEEVGIPVQERITQYRTTSKPMTPSSSTNDLKKPQQQLKHSINKQEQKQSKTVLFVHNRTPPPLTEPPHPLKLDETPADYFGTGSNLLDDVFDEYHPRQSVTCTRPDLVPLQPKRKPTPYSDKGLFHFDFEDDEEDEAQDGHHTLNDQNGKMFTGSPTGYNAEFERLRTEIKKLEKSQKKHKQRELRMHQQMMDTQQQLEYLIQSRSYESNRPCSYHNHESSTWNQYMNRNTNDTTTKATNSSSSNYQFTPSQHKQDPYWYNSYGGYYYMNETPYHHQSYGGYLSSSEPEDYYQEQNEYDRNMATSLPTNFTSSIAIPISKYYNRNSKSLDNYYPSYYSSSALATENERNYYFQPHSQMYPYDYSQHNEDINNTNSRATVIPKNNSKNKKRWTQ